MYKRLTEKNRKQSYVCLQSHVVLCQLEWVRSWSGHHQWVCSLQGTQWEDRNGWTRGSEDKCEACK